MSMFSGEQKSNKQPNVLFRINRRVTRSCARAILCKNLSPERSKFSRECELIDTKERFEDVGVNYISVEFNSLKYASSSLAVKAPKHFQICCESDDSSKTLLSFEIPLVLSCNAHLPTTTRKLICLF
jgi:hypothetical protein